MKKNGGRAGPVAVAVVLLFFSHVLPAAEYHLGLEVADSWYMQDNYLDRYSDRYDRNRNYNLLTVAPNFSLSAGSTVQVYLSGDLQWRYEPGADLRRQDSDHEWDAYMTGAYLSVGDRPFQVVLGLQPMEIGSRLITADDALGCSVTATRHRWSLTGQIAKVMDNSPMAGAALTYTPGLFERLSLFGAWFRDEEDAFAHTLPDPYQLLDPTSSGELQWLGATAEVFLGPARLTLTTAYEQGEITFDHRFGQVHRKVEAYVGDVAVSANLNTRLSTELFFFIASGDDQVRDETLRAFLSPMPLNSRALIFFDPEWQDRNTTNVMTYGGSTFRGVIAPGISLSFAPADQMLLQASGAFFLPQQTPSDDRDQYGWEIDLQANYSLLDTIDLYLQAAHFQYGAFFKNSDGQIPDAAVLFVIGCRAVF